LKKKKLYFIVNQGAFFVSHRLDLALEAKSRGWKVKLLIGQSGSDEMEEPAVEKLKACGIEYKRLTYEPTGINPFYEIWGIIQLVYILMVEKPDIVHTVSPKGMMYGGLASRIARVKRLIIAISGMGYLYTSKGGLIKRLILKIVNWLTELIMSHPNKSIIVQNKDDFDFFCNKKSVCNSEVILIPGSGVDLTIYNQIQSPGNNSVVFPARLLKDKGVFEFIEAVRTLKNGGCTWRFILAGSATYDNPSSVGEPQVNSWVDEGLIDWYGHVADMIPVYKECDIVCLPSYREGMPKVLLEAAAAGKATITTDTIGCREAIIPHVTGLLVPAKDSVALAKALDTLIKDKHLRTNLGLNGRKLAYDKFSIENVVKVTFNAYSSLEGKVENE
jgi:glycosyltransferase involved in cell wall biosynthesis